MPKKKAHKPANTKSRKRRSNPIMLLWAVLPIVGVFVTAYFAATVSGTWTPPQSKKEAPYTYDQIISNKDIQKVQLTGKGAVTLWFDDAWRSQLEQGFTAVTQRGMKAALAIPTNLVGYDAYMNWSEIQFVARSGWEITAHSRNHNCAPQDQTFKELSSEIEGSKFDLERKGFETDIYVSPCGKTSDVADSLILYHYNYSRTTKGGLNSIPVTNPYDLHIREINRDITAEDVHTWVKEAQEENKWLILMFHQIDDTDALYGTDKQTFDAMLDAVENSGIQVVLPSEILE